MNRTAARGGADRIQLGGSKTHKGFARAVTKDDGWTVSSRADDPVASVIRHEYGHLAASPTNDKSAAYAAYREIRNAYVTRSQREARQRIGHDDLGWTRDDMPEYVHGYTNDNSIISEGWAEMFASQGDPDVWSWPDAVLAIMERYPDVFPGIAKRRREAA